MFNLTRYERLAIIVLAAMLLLGLSVTAYKKSRPQIKEPAIGRYDAVGKNGSAEEELLMQRERININTADAETLQKLRGIGKTMAGRIIDYRNSNGPFGTIDDIKKVRGIGNVLFEKIKNRITAG